MQVDERPGGRYSQRTWRRVQALRAEAAQGYESDEAGVKARQLVTS